MVDINISVKVNEYYKLQTNDIYNEELEYAIKSAVEELTKRIKNVSIDVIILSDDDQEAIDIGKQMLNLINKRVEENINQLSISR